MPNDNLLVGFDTSDDASVFRVGENLGLVQSIDFFPPMVDDPFLFGQIAAANSLSDIYAMGGTPSHAMNLLCIPNCLGVEVAGQILAGGADKCVEACCAIAGGHTIQDNEPKYGLCVTGFVHPDRILKNVGAQPGDVLVLEELEHARARGAHIYAEVVGYGANCDAYHFTAPAPGGTGAIDCMKLTLADAGIAPEQVDHINAHGTGTHMNDACETAAIHAVFGEHAKQLTVVSTKSMTGHLLGGAGGIEAVFTALALRDQFAPPTIHYEQPDPECDLDYVPNAGRAQAMTYALSNSLGFGGHNACIALRRWEG